MSAPTLRKGTLGTADIAFFVISAAAPLTVMAGVAPIALLLGGIGAPVGYLVAGITLAIFAVGFTTMSRHVRSAGAFYAYITRGLGKPVGIAAALIAMLGYNGMEIGVYGLLGSATADTAQALWGVDVPWLPVSLLGLLLIWYGGFRSIDFGAKLLGVLLLAETGILVLLAGGVLLDGGGDGGISFASFSPGNVFVPGMAAVLACAFAAFTGFESTVIYRREARSPERTVPRATYIAVAFLGLFYAFVVWSVIQAFGDAKVVQAAADDPGGLFFSTITTYVGPWAADLMHILIVTSVLASLLAFHNAINRYGLALAEEGVLPPVLGRVHLALPRPARRGGLPDARLGLADRPLRRTPGAGHRTAAAAARGVRHRARRPGTGVDRTDGPGGCTSHAAVAAGEQGWRGGSRRVSGPI
ncbi:APC family permease [Streptomyces microflavus]